MVCVYACLIEKVQIKKPLGMAFYWILITISLNVELFNTEALMMAVPAFIAEIVTERQFEPPEQVTTTLSAPLTIVHETIPDGEIDAVAANVPPTDIVWLCDTLSVMVCTGIWPSLTSFLMVFPLFESQSPFGFPITPQEMLSFSAISWVNLYVNPSVLAAAKPMASFADMNIEKPTTVTIAVIISASIETYPFLRIWHLRSYIKNSVGKMLKDSTNPRIRKGPKAIFNPLSFFTRRTMIPTINAGTSTLYK